MCAVEFCLALDSLCLIPVVKYIWKKMIALPEKATAQMTLSQVRIYAAKNGLDHF